MPEFLIWPLINIYWLGKTKSLSSVQLLSRVQLFVTLWTAACQASLPITNSRSLPKLMSIESVMPSSHLILRCPLLLLPSIFPSIRVFSNESALCIRWPKFWSFSVSISPSSEYSGLISFRVESNTPIARWSHPFSLSLSVCFWILLDQNEISLCSLWRGLPINVTVSS